MSAAPTFDPGFSTPEMAALFSAGSRAAAMCRVEAALAVASARSGLIPADHATEIERVCAEPPVDSVGLLSSGWMAGSPVIALLEELRGRLSPAAAMSLHQGATTQDIVDSATMLQAAAGLKLLRGDLVRVIVALVPQARAHRLTPMAGRTFLQQARPTTFGLKVAQWIEPLLRLVGEVDDLSRRLPVQLGGPVGNQEGLGDAADAITADLAARLGLAVPALPWHADRSVPMELVSLAQRVAAASAKIGVDVALLGQTEIGEVRARSGRSSSMPGKQNPIDAARAIAAASACHGAASVVTGAGPHELERAIGAWHAEWFAIPVVFQTAAAAVHAIVATVESLEVDADRMAANLGDAADASLPASSAVLVDRVLDAAGQIVSGA